MGIGDGVSSITGSGGRSRYVSDRRNIHFSSIILERDDLSTLRKFSGRHHLPFKKHLPWYDPGERENKSQD